MKEKSQLVISEFNRLLVSKRLAVVLFQQLSIFWNTVFVGMLHVIWILSEGTEGFVPRPANPGWELQQNNLSNPPELVRPADCETQLYPGLPPKSYKTWADRNMPDPKDRYILVESHLELVIRRGQAHDKTKDQRQCSKNRKKRRCLHGKN